DRRSLARHAVRRLRSSEAREEERQPDQEQRHGNEPPRPWVAGDHVREERRARPGRSALDPAALEPDPPRDHYGYRDEDDEQDRVLEAHSALFRKAASGRSQSPSVESAVCRTPAEARSRTRPSRSCLAAFAKRARR